LVHRMETYQTCLFVELSKKVTLMLFYTEFSEGFFI